MSKTIHNMWIDHTGENSVMVIAWTDDTSKSFEIPNNMTANQLQLFLLGVCREVDRDDIMIGEKRDSEGFTGLADRYERRFRNIL
jgi:hypothetical protein